MSTGIKKAPFIWIGNCYAVACQILEAGLVRGVAIFGHYYGPIAADSHFNNKRAVVQHGWIETPSGGIIDPTRWAFEDVKPYIFYRTDADLDDIDSAQKDGNTYRKEYDTAGSMLREAMQRPCPVYDPNAKTVPNFKIKDPEIEGIIMEWLGNPPRMTFPQLHWLANLSLNRLMPCIRSLYAAIKAADVLALVPMDHQRIVFGRKEVRYPAKA